MTTGDERAQLDLTIEGLRAAYAAAPPGSPAAARLAHDLGRRLTLRYFRQGGATTDRDQAIELLDEALSVPHAAAVTHVGIGVLLFFRVMPIPPGGDPDGGGALAVTTALMTGALNDPGLFPDRDRAIAHLQWVVDHEPPGSEARAPAEALIAMLHLIGGSGFGVLRALARASAGMLGTLGPGGGRLAELFNLTLSASGPRELGTAFDRVLEQLPPGHRLRPIILAEAGALLAQRGHVAGLPDQLAGLSTVVRDALATVRADDPFREQTIRRLAGLLLSATAYQGDAAGAAEIVRIADGLVSEGAGDPVAVGKDRFLRAMALTLRGRLADDPADLRAAAEDLRAAIAAVPASDDLAPAMTGMLGALLNDRYLRHGQRADVAAAGYLATAGNELPGLMSRTVLAVQRRDPAELDLVIDRLESGLAGLPEGYPWRSRLDAGLGLAYLTRATVAARPGDLRSGFDLLRRAGDDLAVEVSGRPALLAAGATADLLQGLTDGDTAAIAAAAERLDEVAGQAGSDRLPLTALRAQAAMIRYEYEPKHRTEDLRTAVTLFEQARSELSPGHPLASHVHTQLALAHRAAGRTADAVESGLAALRAHADDVLLQTGAAHGLESARNAAELARQIAGWCIDDEQPEPALEALELGRGLVLHSAMTATSVPVLLRAAGREDLAVEWATTPPRAQPREAVERIAGELIDIPSDLRLRVLTVLHGRSDFRRLSAAPAPAEITAAMAAADADAIVYLLAGRDADPGRLLCVRADGGLVCRSAPALRIDAPALTAYLSAHDARTASRDMAAADPADAVPSWRQSLGRVCDWAWAALAEPLLAELGETTVDRPHRVVLVPGEALGYVPWHAARTSGTRYACEPFVFSYAASARQFAAVACRPRSLNGKVALLADPTGSLEHTSTEVAILRETYPAAVVLHGTPGEVLHVLGENPEVLHLACHAVSDQAPDRSRLELAKGEDLLVSGILDSAQRRGEADPGGLVVLAACSSDLTTSDYDEALTLATAFLAAGAVSVVGSRWKVNDRITACLMTRFHLYRTADGLGDRDALRAAQLWMIDRRREVPAALESLIGKRRTILADPVAWAPFTHQGG